MRLLHGLCPSTCSGELQGVVIFMQNNFPFSVVLFFTLPYFFSQFVFRDGSDGSECESVLAQDETHKENTKPLLLLTLRSPVSGTLSPSLCFPLSFLQPHLFLTGLERGLASPAVASLFLHLPCVTPLHSCLEEDSKRAAIQG